MSKDITGTAFFVSATSFLLLLGPEKTGSSQQQMEGKNEDHQTRFPEVLYRLRRGAGALEQHLHGNEGPDRRPLHRHQIITPTCWSASPKDTNGVHGPLEQALPDLIEIVKGEIKGTGA
jgi:hypothetical protein